MVKAHIKAKTRKHLIGSMVIGNESHHENDKMIDFTWVARLLSTRPLLAVEVDRAAREWLRACKLKESSM